jgi:hypothetical protein
MQRRLAHLDPSLPNIMHHVDWYLLSEMDVLDSEGKTTVWADAGALRMGCWDRGRGPAVYLR